jgi:hypothetical protein
MFHRAQDSGMRDQITSGLTYMQDLGAGKYALFFLGWLISKSLCLDFLSVFLALASGVLFGGVLEGTAASTVCVSFHYLILALSVKFVQVTANLNCVLNRSNACGRYL